MTTAISDSESLRRASLRYLWMHNRDWTQMAEEGEPQIIESGKGVRVTDSEGNSWIDVNGGYNSVNVGYGREEIGEAAYEQMASLHYFPQGTTTVPMAQLAAKLADIAPGSLSRVFPGQRRLRSERDRTQNHPRIPQARWRTGSIQGHQPHRVVPRHDGGRPVARRQPIPAAPRLRADLPRHAARAAAQPVQIGTRRRDAIRECRPRAAPKRSKDLIEFHGPQTVAAVIAEPVAIPQGAVVPSDEYWPMLRQICRQVRRAAHRGRGDLRLRAHRQDVRAGTLGRRAGHHDRREGHREQLPADGGGNRQQGNRGRLRRRAQYPAACVHRGGASCRGGSVAEEHRNHRKRRPCAELRAGRRVLQRAAGRPRR